MKIIAFVLMLHLTRGEEISCDKYLVFENCESKFESARDKQICKLCKTSAVDNLCTSLSDQFNTQYAAFMSQVFLESLSGILLSLVGFYMMLGTKFKQHPYPLIGFACLVHGGYYFSQVQFLTVCYFNVFNRVEYRRGIFDSIYTSGLLQAV